MNMKVHGSSYGVHSVNTKRHQHKCGNVHYNNLSNRRQYKNANLMGLAMASTMSILRDTNINVEAYITTTC